MRRAVLKGLAVIGLAATLGFSATAQDVDPENVLVIEIAGEGAGTIEILMRPDVAPLHVERIKELARSGAYDGVVFHRVINGFMAQTGDVMFGKLEDYDYRVAGRGGSELPDLPAEFSDITYVEGIIGMARSNSPDSANSQFFIMFDDAKFLDGQYTVIGRVITGMEYVHAIKRGDAGANGSVFENPDYMSSVRVKSEM
jgi:peptidylprolyl isomerase